MREVAREKAKEAAVRLANEDQSTQEGKAGKDIEQVQGAGSQAERERASESS